MQKWVSHAGGNESKSWLFEKRDKGGGWRNGSATKGEAYNLCKTNIGEDKPNQKNVGPVI